VVWQYPYCYPHSTRQTLYNRPGAIRPPYPLPLPLPNPLGLNLGALTQREGALSRRPAPLGAEQGECRQNVVEGLSLSVPSGGWLPPVRTS
jgi:hypothetical protein